MNDDLITALLGTQCALSGEVPSNLRAVSVHVDSVKGFLIDFYYEGEITEEIDESASSIAMEASCGFHAIFPCKDREIRLDPPSKIPLDKILVYLRNERNNRILHELSTQWDFLKHCQMQISQDRFVCKSETEREMSWNSGAIARLAAIPALLGKIPPQLRAVTVEFTGTVFGIHFFFDGEILDENRLLAMSAIEEFRKYVPKGYPVKETIERLDYPERIPFVRFVYRRIEPTTEILYIGPDV